MKNKILLIGMPGCGKTTIGKLLSKELNYNFIDMDKYIVDISGETIKSLFDKGEENFRNFESRACDELSLKKNSVISSGGGVVKRKKNIDLFENESIIIFIDRPIEKIIGDVDTETRPLLANGKEKLYKLFEERYELYKQYSNITVVNDGYLKNVVLEI
ncbi:MAG: shikimate kinase, partial [Clostridium sp.]